MDTEPTWYGKPLQPVVEAVKEITSALGVSARGRLDGSILGGRAGFWIDTKGGEADKCARLSLGDAPILEPDAELTNIAREHGTSRGPTNKPPMERKLVNENPGLVTKSHNIGRRGRGNYEQRAARRK